MNNFVINRKLQRVDNLLALTSQLPSQPEILSNWAKYLCVVICGLLETSIVELYRNLPVGKSSVEVVRFIDYTLQKIPNPDFGSVQKLANRFNEDWRKEIEALKGSEIELAVTSIVSNRINIAHGRDSGVSMQNIRDWYPRVIEFIEVIEEQCLR